MTELSRGAIQRLSTEPAQPALGALAAGAYPDGLRPAKPDAAGRPVWLIPSTSSPDANGHDPKREPGCRLA